MVNKTVVRLKRAGKVPNEPKLSCPTLRIIRQDRTGKQATPLTKKTFTCRDGGDIINAMGIKIFKWRVKRWK